MAYKNPLDPRYREARLRHYHKNKSQYLARNRVKKLELRELINSYKDKPCTDCGIKYPSYVMQFDHIQDNKEHNIARLVTSGNKEKVVKEIKKCEVVCANCHAERTNTRRN